MAPKVLTDAKRERRVAWTSIIVGLVALAVVAAAGASFVLTRPTSLVASASLVVLPDSSLDRESIAGYYETLTRGQVVATYAEILRGLSLENEAAQNVGLSASRTSGTKVDVQVIADTALIEISTTAQEGEVAIALTNEIADLAVKGLRDLDQPYTASLVSEATKTRSAATSTFTLLAVILIIGLVAGLGAAQVVFQLGMLNLRRRAAATEPATADSPAP